MEKSDHEPLDFSFMFDPGNSKPLWDDLLLNQSSMPQPVYGVRLDGEGERERDEECGRLGDAGEMGNVAVQVHEDENSPNVNIDVQQRDRQGSPQKAPISCICKKSKCNKNYCNCYKSGQQCSKNCSCLDCQNTHKIINLQQKQQQQQPLHQPLNQHSPLKKTKSPTLTTASSTGSTKSCKCKTSHCMKNYCTCKSAGRFCGPACGCQDCFNNGEDGDGLGV